MDAVITNLITNLPNFAVALVMLWWQKQTIDQLLATQKDLISQLLQYVDKDKETARRLVREAASSTSRPSEREA